MPTAPMMMPIFATALVVGPLRTTPPRMCDSDFSPSSLAAELQKRGLLTALDELEEDGPSAFKDPAKVIEYVMLNLQHKGIAGCKEAFRFAARPPGKSSFVSGMALTEKRISWTRSRFIGGYVSGV